MGNHQANADHDSYHVKNSTFILKIMHNFMENYCAFYRKYGIILKLSTADLAQLVEQLTCNQ